ncbi:TIGR02444 family protein [Halomonas sp. HP20-15]|uniref:TIGR02444 family protein n=1 Tax=Halomonas sp. HP20-15 TaxID=3085901 RepID=UPI002981F3F1|nr:TIGR02444 family protein [Halomonas sp. HP20-15]MDW5376087.1 TIGR02444 family protein [Halomonas sp. HP20-15]
MTDHCTQSPFAVTAPDALWRYALATYGDPAIASACLVLQDRADADVCELLWLGWLDHLGLVTTPCVCEALAPVREHQTRRTYPLRARRRALKPHARPGSPLADWRERLKHAELAAEREALEQLQALTRCGEGIRPWRSSDGDLQTRLASHLGGHLDDTLAGALMTLAVGLQAIREPGGV